MGKKTMSTVSVLCFAASIVLIVLFFMPLWNTALGSVTGDIKSGINDIISFVGASGDLKADDITSTSLFSMTKLFYTYGDIRFAMESNPHAETIKATLMMALPGLAGIAIALFALLKLPILMGICEGIGALAFVLDMNYLGTADKVSVIGMSAGIGYSAYLPCMAVLGVLTLVLFFSKGIYKRTK